MPIDTSKDYYVIVAEFDCPEASASRYNHPREGPLALETYIGKQGTLEQAREDAKRFSGLGEVRIAKLQFVD
jgi:hypothetical protein